MKFFFVPGIKLIDRLKYSQKFGLISLLLILFITMLLIIIIRDLNQKIEFRQKKRIGIEYITPIINILQDVQGHNERVIGYLNGYKELKQQIDIKKIAIKNELDEIKKLTKNIKIFSIFQMNWKKL